MVRNDLDRFDLKADEWWKPNGEFSSLKGLNPPRFEFFDRYVPDWNGAKVLDVGCGGGYTSEFLAKRGAIVSGIDLSKKSIEAARKHAAQTDLKIDYQHGSAEALPYGDNSFDAVICVDVLEHINDLNQVVSEIHRVLKQNCMFFFDTINRTFKSKIAVIWLMEVIFKNIPRGAHDWRKFIKPEELRNIMISVGLVNIEMKGFHVCGRDKKTRNFNIQINDNLSIIYIGKAVKPMG